MSILKTIILFIGLVYSNALFAATADDGTIYMCEKGCESSFSETQDNTRLQVCFSNCIAHRAEQECIVSGKLWTDLGGKDGGICDNNPGDLCPDNSRGITIVGQGAMCICITDNMVIPVGGSCLVDNEGADRSSTGNQFSQTPCALLENADPNSSNHEILETRCKQRQEREKRADEKQKEWIRGELEKDTIAAALADAKKNLNSTLSSVAQFKRQACREAYSNFKSSCTNAKTKIEPSKPTTSKSTCEAVKTQANKVLVDVNSQKNMCRGLRDSLKTSCPGTTGVLSANGTATLTDSVINETVTKTVTLEDFKPIPENGSKVSTAIPIYSKLESDVGKVETEYRKRLTEANACIAKLDPKPDPTEVATPDPDPEPTTPGGDWKDHKPKTVAAKKSGFSIGELAKAALPLALPSLLGGGDGEQPDAPPKQPTPNYTDDFYSEGSNSSSGPISKTRGLNLAKGSGGNDTNSLPDQSLGRDRNEVNAKFNGKTNRSGSPGAGNNSTVANSANGSDSGSGGSGSDARQRRVASAKARNLISGHKSVRANDGGGGLSIRPGAYKKYGRAAMLAKLAAARKKHGKKMPLIFKNGKFVLDFFAMKESKTFKKKHAAMEGYWKGKKPKSPTAKNDVNPNSKLNIFKLMNFRYQKTLYTKDR